MDVIFSTGSLWCYSVERCFDLAARAGFDGIEIMIDQRWETRLPEHLLGLMDRYGLPIRAVHSPTWPTVPGWQNDPVERVLSSLTLAEALGAEVLVHHLPARMGYSQLFVKGQLETVPIPWQKPEEAYRRWIEEEYEATQARTPVRLCMENMPAVARFGRIWDLYYWNTLDDLLELSSLALDTTNLGTWDIQPARVWSLMEKHTGHIHLSNFDEGGRRPLDEGKIYMDFLMIQVVSSRYKGTLSIEMDPEALEAGGPDERVIAQMQRSLKYIRDYVADARPLKVGAPGWPV